MKCETINGVTLSRENCDDLLARYPDKRFDLAVVDPPYGIGKTWTKDKPSTFYHHRSSYTNTTIPGKTYFDELRRVARELIVFGYNYFTEFLGPTNYLIVWDKMSNVWSQAEIAYTTIRKPLQIIQVPWDGYRTGKEKGVKKIHPHQKPVELYKKILARYAKPGWSILDTHLGSGSIALACLDMGFPLTACEIDEAYFAAARNRVALHASQMTFDFSGRGGQQTLFDETERQAG